MAAIGVANSYTQNTIEEKNDVSILPRWTWEKWYLWTGFN